MWVWFKRMYGTDACIPDALESSDADSDVVVLVQEVVERRHHAAVSRRPDGSYRLTEPDV